MPSSIPLPTVSGITANTPTKGPAVAPEKTNEDATNTNVIADGYIQQSERLFTSRPRSVINTGADAYKQGLYERGTRAYITLVSNSSTQKILDRSSSLPYLNGNVTPIHELMGYNNKPGQDGYADFLLTSVSSSSDEKTQVTQVFGDTEVVYFFGRNPISFNFSGMLVDSPDNNWFVQWIEMYNTYLRGTELARNYELVRIVLPNMIVVGSITNMSWQQSSTDDVFIPFSFTFLAKSITPTGALMTKGVYSTEVAMLSFSTDGLPILTQSSINAIKLAAQAEQAAYDKTFAGGITNSINGASNTIGEWTKGITNGPSALHSVTSALTGVRTSLFSPVFGVLSSLTKLVKSVTGSLSSVLKAFTNPLKGILRDITSISNEASGLITALNNGINGLGSELQSTTDAFRSTIDSLKNTQGAFGSAPRTLGDSFKLMIASGSINSNTSPVLRSSTNNAILPVGVKASNTSVVLGSGVSSASTSAGAVLTGIPIVRIGSAALSSGTGSSSSSTTASLTLSGQGGRFSKLDLLSSGVKFTPSRGAAL